MTSKLCAAAVFASLTITAPAYSEDEAHSKLSAFVIEGQKLYDRAAMIVRKRPATYDDIYHIKITIGNQWAADESAFKTSFWPWRAEVKSNIRADVQEGMIRIWQFDNFIVDAVTDSYVCQNVLAQWDLEIAGQILAHAKMASEGRPAPEWNPNLTAPDDHEKCS